jgi:hypothetical protein
MGQPTKDRSIRQILVRFGQRGYVVRYRILPTDGTIFVTRIWHGPPCLKIILDIT